MSKAAVELNHKELDGREINVEVARPKTSAAATTESTDDAPRKRSTRRKSKVNVYMEGGLELDGKPHH
jgi:RNA recognition motif-containing protein